MKRFILTLAFIAISIASFSQVVPTGKEGYVAYRLYVEDYGLELNKTRVNAGSDELVRQNELDAYCYERCLRLMEIFLSDPDAFVINNDVLVREGHKDWKIMENAGLKYMFKIPTVEDFNSYNLSPGHYKCRVNPEWSNFGTAAINISFVGINRDYDPSNPTSRKRMPLKLTISYEAFK